MIQKIEDQDGYILLHFGAPPAYLSRIEFVVILAHQQKRILFCKSREDGDWVLPGGRVEVGETPEEAAHRELFEETGATLRDIETLCYMHCFMFGLEYWGIAYMGEIEQLGTPTDLNEITEAALLLNMPDHPSKRFANQAKALTLLYLKRMLL